jgi:ankyrin repeat protein
MKKIIFYCLGIMLVMGQIAEAYQKAPWQIAFDNDDPAFIQLFKNDPSKKDIKIDNYLLYAAEAGKYNIAKALIDMGVNVNMKSDIYWTPLHYAALKNNLKIAELLVQHGAKVNAKGGIQVVTGKKRLDTPLHIACYFGNFESLENFKIVKLLIEHGADVNAKDFEGYTPLHIAVGKKNTDVVKILLEHGAKVNTFENEHGHSPLNDGCGFEAEDAVKLLINYGAKPNNQEKDTLLTPLHRAVLWKNKEIINLLLSHGADLTIKNKEGLTPMELARKNGDKEIIEILENAESNSKLQK